MLILKCISYSKVCNFAMIFMEMWYSFHTACTISSDKLPAVSFCEVSESL